ncbi:hypothetical protein CDIK_2902 [Cucumispora dikerogammari]|nr:hypothetical protein CDIK_2902 [Cucumispora dikerogammari]
MNTRLKSSKAIKVVKRKRDQNISSLVVIKDSIIVTYETKDSAFEGNVFIEFIRNKLKLHFKNNQDAILIIVNCSFHNKRNGIAELKSNNNNHRFLPPYHHNNSKDYVSYFKANLVISDQKLTN